MHDKFLPGKPVARRRASTRPGSNVTRLAGFFDLPKHHHRARRRSAVSPRSHRRPLPCRPPRDSDLRSPVRVNGVVQNASSQMILLPPSLARCNTSVQIVQETTSGPLALTRNLTSTAPLAAYTIKTLFFTRLTGRPHSSAAGAL